MSRIVDIISDVVDAIKEFELLSGVADAGNLYDFTINLSDVQYWYVGMRLIVEANAVETYGTVTAINGAVLKVNLGATGLNTFTNFRMDINYRHGHPVDVFDQLQRMALNANYKMRRFPVIALMQDFDEGVEMGITETPVQIILAVRTSAKYTAAERYNNSYDGKRLTLLSDRFIKYLRYNTSTYFKPGDITSKIDRLYWGREGALGNEDNKAYDLIDAIELNINLKTFETC